MVGAGQLSAGAAKSASGAGQLASGATSLADGATQLTGGATSLADGLTQATGKVPSYSTDQADHLAQVIADPVTTDGGTTDVFGSRIVPYLMVLALWLGGLASFLVLGAFTPHALGSTRPSWQLALRSFAPAAVVGIVQGLALTAIMAPTLTLSPGGWTTFTVVACLAGVAFAAINQGLAAALRGIGRFLAVLLATIGLASAVISTVPAFIGSAYAVSPLGPALQAMQSVTAGGAIAGPIALLMVWGLGGLALTTAALARHRVIPAGQLARWSRAA
jgi:putative membrane protein